MTTAMLVLLVPLVAGFLIAWGVACSLWEAFVAWRVYGWLLAPLGLPPLPFTAFLAADMLLTLATIHLIPWTPEKPPVSRLFFRPLLPALMLATAAWLR